MFYKKQKIYYKLPDVSMDVFVIAIDKISYYCYIYFKSIQEFYNWYSTLRPYEKICHEVIRTDIRKFLLDIDTPNDISNFKDYDFQTNVTIRIQYIFQKLDIGIPNIIIYDMCSSKKISYHFVVSNFSFTTKTCLALCLLISKQQPWETLVDTGIYKNIQCIRLEQSTKANEKRWKKPITPGNFIDGLISYTTHTVTSNLTCTIYYPDVCRVGLYEYDTNAFVIRKVCNNVTFLKRIKPSYCHMCYRIHHKENAMIKNNTFYCFRQ